MNLTCGRNPWKSASTKDSTFRAYLADRHFLKTILPISDELNSILNMIFEIDPARRISLAELRHRIATCSAFTKPAAGTPDVEVVADTFAGSDSDLDVYSEALSPASTISEEGSMVSDSSDESTPSEAGTPDFDVPFEVMDEDASYDDFAPASPKDWVPEASYVVVDTPYVFSRAEDSVAPATQAMASVHLTSEEQTAPSQVQTPQRYISPCSAAPRQPKSMQQLIARCVTPSILNPFCPQGNQRGNPVRRAF